MTPTVNAFMAAFNVLLRAGIPLPSGIIIAKETFNRLVFESDMRVRIPIGAQVREITLLGVRIRESRG